MFLWLIKERGVKHTVGGSKSVHQGVQSGPFDISFNMNIISFLEKMHLCSDAIF